MSSPYENTVILQENALDQLIGLVKNYPVAGSGTGIQLSPVTHVMNAGEEDEMTLNRLQIWNAIQIDSTLELGGVEFTQHPACLKITDKSVQAGDTVHPAVRYLQVGSLLGFSPENESGVSVGQNGTFSVHENGTQNAHIVRINGFDKSGNYTGTVTGPLNLSSSNKIIVSNKEDAAITRNSDQTVSAITAGSIQTQGGIAAKLSIKGYKLYGAVFNDYAEYRQTAEAIPGDCVIENGNGSLSKSTDRLQPGANIVSDTFGFSIGETDKAQTPIAVCGRVLAYPLEDKNAFKAGDAVCSGPNGTISLMTREEIKEWPDRIVGYVSEIPTYEKWGSDNIEVRNRIWIKVK